MIAQETVMSLAYAHREVEVAEKLLASISEGLSRRQPPDVRDAFGRQSMGLQLGIPSGDNSQRLLHVEWALAKPVIEAHIASLRAQIAALNERARVELDTAT